MVKSNKELYAKIRDAESCNYESDAFTHLVGMIKSDFVVQPKNLETVIKVQDRKEDAICVAYENDFISKTQFEDLMNLGGFNGSGFGGILNV